MRGSVRLGGITSYHTTSSLGAGQEWRKKRGFAANPNAYGPLVDGPDYSFIDGRPTPPGSGKIRRAVEQREIATKILELSKEVDFALEHHQKRLNENEAQKRQILNRKLKPKGQVPS